MFSVWGHSTYEKKDDKELMQPQEQPIRRTAAQEKRKKICMYCIKINRERRHWKSYAHKPGHVQNDSGSKKQKKKKKNPKTPKGGERWKGKGKGKSNRRSSQSYTRHMRRENTFQSESTKSESRGKGSGWAPVESDGKCQKSFCLSWSKTETK